MRSRSILIAALVALAALGLVACEPRGSASIPEPKGLSQETTKTSIFYSTGESLVEEYRVVDSGDVYRKTLDELLLAEPDEHEDIAIVQPVAEVRSVQLDKKGVLTIDWAPGILEFDAARREKVLALAAVLRTYGEFPEVKKVRFTVDGETEGKAGGKDIKDFWGDVSLNGQPWDVIRPQVKPEETTSSAQ